MPPVNSKEEIIILLNYSSSIELFPTESTKIYSPSLSDYSMIPLPGVELIAIPAYLSLSLPVITEMHLL
jgi:hypothetical protein